MDDYIEREPLLKAFKEKCCQDCPGGYTATSSATVGAMQQARLN